MPGITLHLDGMRFDSIETDVMMVSPDHPNTLGAVLAGEVNPDNCIEDGTVQLRFAGDGDNTVVNIYIHQEDLARLQAAIARMNEES